ncbi:MAG: hypothetical protein KDD48_08470 [Bdellovibrionales bacterium]|nr:hypothetical protein [Bdellovibrionales bacterium]
MPYCLGLWLVTSSLAQNNSNFCDPWSYRINDSNDDLGKCQTLRDRFPAPTNFVEREYPEYSFQWYLQRLPLKEPNAILQVPSLDKPYEKLDRNPCAAVVDWPVWMKERQCADTFMGLFVHWMVRQGIDPEVKIPCYLEDQWTTELFSYSDWLRGKTAESNRAGIIVKWNTKQEDRNLDGYLEKIYAWIGTSNFQQAFDLVEIQDLRDAEVGDLLLKPRTGKPINGHLSFIVNIADSIEETPSLVIIGEGRTEVKNRIAHGTEMAIRGHPENVWKTLKLREDYQLYRLKVLQSPASIETYEPMIAPESIPTRKIIPTY